jgi:ATP-dependent helicase HepA
MSDFHRVLLGIHAAARRLDRDQALLGALGVGAFAYTHQIDSVHRMVTGTTCRWLLADEVGLGKTIQAIMVMRALAAQSPRPLTAALVVPDDLVSQWEEELLCRGHVLALESGDEGGVHSNLVMRLIRPSRLRTGKRIAAERIDLLLVDEFTKLQVQVREELINASRTIPNIIAMTATPALHQPRTRRELMALLEPEADRIARAEVRDILKVLAERETKARETYGHELQDAEKRRSVEEAFGLYRRLIRTVRTDYPDTLPKRNYQPIKIPPTDGDLERARTTRTYLNAASQANLDIHREALLQVAGRSPQSLRERLSTLRRTTPDLQTAWQKIDACLRDDLGDAKLDALIDHLRIFHAKNPNGRAVVVAEDNPTTDYLRDAIEKLTDMQVARKRRNVGVAEELEVQVDLLKEALDDFISGEAKILVAADAAREGHNLQFADQIIFFALPWSPPDIQQWIGRIDRLGAKGLPANRRIAITPIVVENSIENSILTVLEGTGVFLRSEVFDESEWEDISEAIGEAANGVSGTTWSDAAKQAKRLGDAYDTWLAVTNLPPTPRTALAARCEARYHSRQYAAPLAPIEGLAWNWYVMRERAVDMMINLACEDHLEVRKKHYGEQHFKTMWYKTKPDVDDLTIPDIDPHNSWHRQAFISCRAEIECPPRTNVVENDGVKRRLNFLDHGCGIHDGAIVAFEKQAPVTDMSTEFIVAYPDGHPILNWANRRLLIAVSELDLRDALTFDPEAILGVADSQASKAERDARSTVGSIALAQFQADRRWMIELVPPEMLFVTLVEDSEEMVVANAGTAVFDPFQNGSGVRQLAHSRSMLSKAQLMAAQETAMGQLAEIVAKSLRSTKQALLDAVPRRRFAAEADAANLAAAAEAELKVATALDSKFEFNRAAVRGAELMLALSELAWLARLARLGEIRTTLSKNVKLKPPKFFWLVPKAASEGNP